MAARPARGTAAQKCLGILAAVLLAVPLGSYAANELLGGEVDLAPSVAAISIQVIRSGPTEANVIGLTDGVGLPIDVLVNGQVVRSGLVTWLGEYWFLGVPVTDGATVKTRIALLESPTVVVPAHIPVALPPSGFIYALGTQLMRDATEIDLFGVNEATAFSYALQAWGYNRAQDAGKNQLFPSGPDTQIPGVVTVDDLWREYFRYFLHYQQSTDPGSPAPNLLRIWIVDLNWGDFAYDLWESQRATFYAIFDRMLYWADRAGVYIVPVIGQNIVGAADNTYYVRSSANYARHLAFARDLLGRYDADPAIAMWDLWNEADVLNDAYWASVGGITGYRAWLTGLVADLRPYSDNHLFTVGSAQWPDLPGLPTVFGWQKHFLFNDIPGLDVSHEHAYFGVEDQYLVDWRAGWGEALGRPYFVGEIGYNGQRLNPLGYGYWPWFSRQWRAADAGPLATMVFVNNGKGAYADYPYLGSLPAYPPEDSPPPPPPPPTPLDVPVGAWRGRYFDNEDFTNLKLERLDSAIDFPWGMGSPDGLIAADTFSARWDGYWDFPQDGIYRFTMTTDDGLRVWADNGSVLDSWIVQPPTTYVRDIEVSAGRAYVEVDYFERTGEAISRVAWSYLAPPPPPPPPANIPPDAVFAYSPASPQVGEDVRFDASASTDDRGIVEYAWTFGDGQTGTGQIVSRAYASSGAYDVSLTVRDADGASDTMIRSVDVLPVSDPGPNGPPQAGFVYAPTAPVAGEVVRFDASQSTDDVGVIGYAWDFGDGGTSAGQVVTHAYPAAGTYNVTLTVRDTDGAEGTARASVRVDPLPAPGVNAPPVAAFEASPSPGLEGATILFDASASTDDEGIVRYHWNFGDGQTSEGQVVTHVYSDHGWFTVSLTVQDADGATDAEVMSLRIFPVTAKPKVLSASWNPDRSQLDVTFSQAMNRTSVSENLRIDPAAVHVVDWANDSHLLLTLNGLAGGGLTYLFTILSGATDLDGNPMLETYTFEFVPAGAPAPSSPWPLAFELPFLSLAAALVTGLLGAVVLLRRDRSRSRDALEVLLGQVDPASSRK